MTTLSFANGKYTLIEHLDGRLEALRYGEPWRDLTGDKLVLGLAQEVAILRDALARLRDSRPSQKWANDIVEAALAGQPLPDQTLRNDGTRASTLSQLHQG